MSRWRQPIVPTLVAGGLLAASAFILVALIIGGNPSFLRILDFFTVIAGMIAILAIPFALVGFVRNLARPREERVLMTKGALVFAIAIIISLLVGRVSESLAQFEVLQTLHAFSDQCSVSIDGRGVSNSRAVLRALQDLQDVPAHHSSPTRTRAIDISDASRSLHLWFARDSSNGHEYWVFAPSPARLALKAGLRKDVGHVITSVFDE